MKYYQESIEKIYDELHSSKDGLTQVQANQRIEKDGFNQLNTSVNISKLKILFNQVNDFITYLLLFAAFVSFISAVFESSEHYADVVIILVILIANVTIGFFQEYSAQKSLEALKKMNIITVKVLRNNKIVEMDSKFLARGDIISLEAGDKVPADCRIIDAKRLKIDESTLTGESVPVEKYSDVIKDEVQICDQKNMVFGSTTLSEGTCKAIVVETGMQTQIGKITQLVKDAKDELTPLQVKLEKFGRQLGYAIITICFIIFVILFAKDGFDQSNIMYFVLIAISLAVAAVPTALPAVVTVSLSIGVKKLLKKNALVRKLSSVETLGSCDIICTDKTGTLTKNQMTVLNAWTLDDETEITGLGYSIHGEIKNGKINNLLFEIGMFCNNAGVYKEKNVWQIAGDPTEAALIVSGKKAHIKDDATRIDEIPFDSNRKMMTTLCKKDEKSFIVYSKGSVSSILKCCTFALVNDKKVPITQDIKKRILEQNDEYSLQALRVLAFAYKEIKNTNDFNEKELVFVGLQAMVDPPREEVAESMMKAKKAGIRVIMITGDHKTTAKAIGEKVGIYGNVLTGDEIDELNDFELKEKLKDDTNIFARVIPEHKQRIVTLLQEQGHIVAMTGDGVNDAPALKKANIGVAVGSGTDVAKEASDFVLLDDSFANIVDAVEEGRGIYDNIQKSIMLLLSGNFGEVLIVFLAVVFNFNLPLTAILLLWINMITDGAPALAYSVDPYGKNIMLKKPLNPKEGILPKRKLFLISYLGIIGSVIGLILFKLIGGNLDNHILGQTLIFNFIVMYELLLVFFIRNEYSIKQFSNIWLWLSVIISIVLQIIIVHTGFNKIFKIVPLNLLSYQLLFAGGMLFTAFYMAYFITVKKYLKA